MSSEITDRDGQASMTDRTLHRVVAEIVDGLRHGHFEYTLTCAIVGKGKRRLILRAGKHYQFLIEAAECERGNPERDPEIKGADAVNALDATHSGWRKCAAATPEMPTSPSRSAQWVNRETDSVASLKSASGAATHMSG